MNLISLSEKILLAGANGMAGKSIHKSLKNSGYGNINNNGLLLTPTRDEIDFSNFEKTKEYFEFHSPSVVIIAAAKVGGIYANRNYPTEFILDNLKIQNNIIENSWKTGVKRLLFLGSSCIYPKYSEQPIKEESLLCSQLECTNEYYAIAKIAGIKLCEALRSQYSFDAISLMPTNLYGEGDNYHNKNSHVVPALIRKFYEAKKKNEKSVFCWGTGEPKREFMNAYDLGSAAVFALEKWNPDDKNSPKNSITGTALNYLNIGTGKDITIKELAETIAKKIGYEGMIKWEADKEYNGTPRKLLDVSRINKLGWEAKIDLDIGLEKTIKDFAIDYDYGVIRK